MAAFSTTRELKANYNSENVKSANFQYDLVSNLSKMSYTKYFEMEIKNTYELNNEHEKYEEKIEKVYTLIRIPFHLEKFFLYGFMLALDSFIFVLAMLPIRLFLIIKSVLLSFFGRQRKTSDGRRKRMLEPAQICDIVRVLLTVFCCCSLQWIDLSFLYHQVRGQNVLKVYIIFNMLDVADRLFSTLGQDLMDTVFWTATRIAQKDHAMVSISALRALFKFLFQFFLAFMYICVHSVIILLEATTLSVAFNSHNKSLLIVMMSNNFAELKGTVFKKFDKNNLYQLTCSDVRERLHLLILLVIVSVRNLRELNWDVVYFGQLLPELALVGFSEIIVDWVKHCFIAKFNEIPADVYSEYRLSLAMDWMGSKKKDSVSEHCDVVARKMGHNPIPLVCVLFKTFDQILFLNDPICALCSAAVIIPVSIAIKFVTSVHVLKQSCQIIKGHRDSQRENAKSVSQSDRQSHNSTPVHQRQHSPQPPHNSASQNCRQRVQHSISLPDTQLVTGEGDPTSKNSLFRDAENPINETEFYQITQSTPAINELHETHLLQNQQINAVSDSPLLSASLEQLNQSQIGQGPLFTENSTVNLPAYQLSSPSDEEEASNDMATEIRSNVSPTKTVKFLSVDTIEASQSDDELVRQQSRVVHDKAE
ncbi:transmembrane anterior posterior transformation protein 1 homolog [Convolutriloba macropyga]|uniref:transmembrane anterior posterior transformation protein 1 homolog n=1 Tax=Convolutriloba macropyga TaxID=536237 RepID=UPI003F51EF29